MAGEPASCGGTWPKADLQMTPPKTLEEAISNARTVMSADDKDVLRNFSLAEAGWRLYLTLGHQLRGEFGLWTEGAQALFDDINAKMPNRLAIDGESASAALIDALWHDARSRA